MVLSGFLFGARAIEGEQHLLLIISHCIALHLLHGGKVVVVFSLCFVLIISWHIMHRVLSLLPYHFVPTTFYFYSATCHFHQYMLCIYACMHHELY